jgi:hypothetical protein
VTLACRYDERAHRD